MHTPAELRIHRQIREPIPRKAGRPQESFSLDFKSHDSALEIQARECEWNREELLLKYHDHEINASLIVYDDVLDFPKRLSSGDLNRRSKHAAYSPDLSARCPRFFSNAGLTGCLS